MKCRGVSFGELIEFSADLCSVARPLLFPTVGVSSVLLAILARRERQVGGNFPATILF